MQHNLSGRFALILTVTFLALYALWPNAWKVLLKPFKPDTKISWAPNLEQGLDMKGGVSLLYEIKTPPGQVANDQLSEQVAAALKTRIDPNGVRGLVWRPQGANRLEIQLPAGGENADARAKRETFLEAEKQLKSINVAPLSLLSAIENPDPAARQQQLDAYVQGSAIRRQVVDDLLRAHQTIATLREKWKNLAPDAPRPTDELAAYLEAQDALLPNAFGDKLARTNIDVAQLRTAMGFKVKAERERRIAEIRNADPSFERRAQLVDAYVKAYEVFAPVQDQVDSVAKLKFDLRGSGVLSFHVVANPNDPALPLGTIDTYHARLLEEGPRFRPGDQFRWYKLGPQEQAEQSASEQIKEQYLKDRIKRTPSDDPYPYHEPGPSVAKFNGEFYQLLWITDEKSMINREGGSKPKWALTRAFPTQDQGGIQTVIAFEFDPPGATQFSELTGRHKPGTPGAPYLVAAVLDEQVISAPTIQAQIGASGTISGGGKAGFSPQESDYLAKTLSAGALPAQLQSEPLVERIIGPQLGADNLRRGLLACAAGVVVVGIFLISYYFLSGVVAMIAVLLNVLLILAGMSAFGATFTLPGVAGIILTIGMAVDANVLIFERLREEQQRGLGIRVALHNAYKRALSAIVDSNITTGISALVLYLIGTEEVKGFGLTLMLGILSSMFTSLYVTRTIFYVMTEKWGIQTLTSLPLRYPKLDRALRPNIDWMRLAPVFITFSAVFLIAGMSLFAWKWQQNQLLDIEFAGGTAVTIELKEPMRLEEVRQIVQAKSASDPAALPAVNVTSVGDAQTLGEAIYKSYEIITPSSDRPAVMGAISTAFTGKLSVADPVRFEGVDDTSRAPTLDALLAQGAGDRNKTRIVGIHTGDEQIEPGFRPEGLENFAGGVAIVLENVRPMLDPRQIESRIDQQRMESGDAASHRTTSVLPLPDGAGIVILTVDPANPFTGDNLKAAAAPMWDKVVGGLTAPAEFERVSGIDKSVASQARDAAIGALIVSVLGIVVYIWVRFGDLKYGSATIIALVHDTLFGLAAIGFAHVLAETFFGRALLIDPFRINLTMVSGILTILGFSMNDTVVVFDRIRELRGQRGHLDRQIINDAINQTLSRTILTGGTTIATILFMYCLGGEAIHGFTYALFVGFLAGTYSSIAIAAPLLLVGLKKEDRTAPVRPTTAPVASA